MTHPQHTAPAMVVQYGYRDDDDEEDSEDERTNSLFGGVLGNRNKGEKGGNKLGAMLGASITSLGASMTFSTKSEEDDEDLTSDEEDLNGEDSKTNMASKAKKAIKNFGDSLRFSRHREREYYSSSDEDSSDDEDGSSGDDMDDQSVASRASNAVRKVTGKLSQALRVGRRRDEDSDSDSEEEEDPLNPNQHNKRSSSRGILSFGRASMRKDSSEGSSGSSGRHRTNRRSSNERETNRRRSNERETNRRRSNERETNRRRSNERETNRRRSNESKQFQRTHSCEVEASNNCTATTTALRRATTTEAQMRTSPRSRRNRPISRSLNSGAGHTLPHTTAQAEVREDGLPAGRSPTSSTQMLVSETTWSMNVTEKMLEQAANEGVLDLPQNVLGAPSSDKSQLRA